MTGVMHSWFLIPSLFDAVTAELISHTSPLSFVFLAPPLLDHLEHGPSSIGSTVFSTVAKGRMVKDTGDYPGESPVNIHSVIIPARH